LDFVRKPKSLFEEVVDSINKSEKKKFKKKTKQP